MSTTFAIIGKDNKKVKIAHRYSLGGGKVGIKWLDIKLIDLLKVVEGCKNWEQFHQLEVNAIDNTQQGVNTINDLIILDENGTLNNINLNDKGGVYVK
tara:strand:+ start:179 stop:472 length:294 start_codon:yes stop_codon:yes gene_type:complete